MTINLSIIKAERIASELTQDEVAKKMGWKSRSPYAKRENGMVAIGADELIKLASIFGYGIDELGIFFKSNVPEKEQIEA